MDILVENLGRINFGKYLLQNKKGITQNVLFNNQQVSNWQMYSLPFNHAEAINLTSGNNNIARAPVIKSGYFNLQKPADTYLDMRKWGKGVVWINGHNLGRYWQVGPQQTLYVPAEWLKKGQNEVRILELLKPQQTVLSTLNKPILNELQ